MKTTLRLYLLTSILALVACGPSVPKVLSLPEVQVKEVGEQVKGPGGVPSYVFVDDFIDSRIEQAIARIDGQSVAHRDEIGQVVRSSMRKALERKGFIFSDTAPIVLSGELRKWAAEVEGGFNSKIKSEASLYIEILDPANKRIYAGVYNGFSNVEGPSLGKEDIQAALGVSMEEAITQVLKDPQLIKLLNSF